MSRMLSLGGAIAIALASAACSQLQAPGGIMKEAPGDPVGSANIGTGSVTTNSSIPPEAKSAGIGLAP